MRCDLDACIGFAKSPSDEAKSRQSAKVSIIIDSIKAFEAIAVTKINHHAEGNTRRRR